LKEIRTCSSEEAGDVPNAGLMTLADSGDGRE
jgi:hypothetical protein